MDTSNLMTFPEVCAALRISFPRLNRYVAALRLDVGHVGGMRVLKRTDLKALQKAISAPLLKPGRPKKEAVMLVTASKR